MLKWSLIFRDMFKGVVMATESSGKASGRSFLGTLFKLIAGVLALLGVAFVALVVLNIDSMKRHQLKARQAEAKVSLNSLYVIMESNQIEYGKYSAEALQTEIENLERQFRGKLLYQYGFTQAVKEMCNDCGVTDDGYKMVAYANLDEDETLDVWTMDHKKTMVHVVNDIEK